MEKIFIAHTRKDYDDSDYDIPLKNSECIVCDSSIPYTVKDVLENTEDEWNLPIYYKGEWTYAQSIDFE